MNYQVREGQNIFDVCIQQYGTMSNLFDLLSDNGLNVNSNLSSGQLLTVNNIGVGNDTVKNTVTKQNLFFVNDQQKGADLLGGDYNDDYLTSNDYL